MQLSVAVTPSRTPSIYSKPAFVEMNCARGLRQKTVRCSGREARECQDENGSKMPTGTRASRTGRDVGTGTAGTNERAPGESPTQTREAHVGRFPQRTACCVTVRMSARALKDDPQAGKSALSCISSGSPAWCRPTGDRGPCAALSESGLLSCDTCWHSTGDTGLWAPPGLCPSPAL